LVGSKLSPTFPDRACSLVFYRQSRCNRVLLLQLREPGCSGANSYLLWVRKNPYDCLPALQE
jgi:hypothetical protein